MLVRYSQVAQAVLLAALAAPLHAQLTLAPAAPTPTPAATTPAQSPELDAKENFHQLGQALLDCTQQDYERAQPAPEQPYDVALREKYDQSIAEVARYRQALAHALEQLPKLPLDDAAKGAITAESQVTLKALLAIEEALADVYRRRKNQFDRPKNLADLQRKKSADDAGLTWPNEAANLEELEAILTQDAPELQKRQERFSYFESRAAERPVRLGKIPQELAAARASQRELEEAVEPPAGEPEELSVTKRNSRNAQRRALELQLAALDAEQQLISTGAELLQLQRDVAARELQLHQAYHEKLRERINATRLAEANRAAESAQEKAKAAEVTRPEALVLLAQRNAELAQQRATLVEQLAQTDEQLSARKAEFLRLSADFETSKSRADELSEEAGQLLRRKWDDLPDLRELRRLVAMRQPLRQSLIFSQYEVQDRRNTLGEISDETALTLAQLPPLQRSVWRHEVETLLDDQRKLLDELNSNYTNYVLALISLDSEEQKIIGETERFNEFITGRVLWVRSCLPLQVADLRPATDAIRWATDVANWRDVGRSLGERVRASTGKTMLIGLVVMVLIITQRKTRHRLRAAGEEASKRSCVRFRPTLIAVWDTLLIAAPWPMLVWLAGWLLDSPFVESEFVRALSAAFRKTAACFFLLEVARHICRSGGVGEKHFAWPESVLKQTRHQLRWLSSIGLPLTLLAIGLDAQSQPLWSSSLGRMAFIAVQLLLAWSVYRVLGELKNAPRPANKAKTASELLRPFWTPLASSAPLALALVAGVGYYYTAMRLSAPMIQTAALLLAVAMVGGLLTRWVLINRRKLAREQARQRRAQLAAAAAEQEVEGAVASVEVLDEAVDLNALSEQTRKLLGAILLGVGAAGVWFVWRDLLPAFDYLGKGYVPGAGSTWSQVFNAIAVIVITYICVRDMPALLELVILQHLPIDGGARYAISTMCRYLLVVLGVYLTGRALLFDWRNTQWLLAAMGVGLGFGLQEIFANFVSGIILLFERPIRIGDIITLGDKTGAVNRIRIRATTIIDSDRKEYVVPNKDLVTERLLNWTLSDQVNRVVVNVGVAYGVDTSHACEVLRQVALDHPVILKDPAPTATFEGFGDSTLSLVLRCYLPNLEHRLGVIHDLHTEVSHRFQESGIEIAFPQRDLNIRTLPDSVKLPFQRPHKPILRATGTHDAGEE